ncbi:histidine kinase N-terminal 7TM domain-containing protein [Wukongibacter baidiensis]|uniref:histidine kinase N-terminal 7TM domain-containing diguanylate cyclase/phosphohydrolase n=1 Tax=Wukongibacter baidiensis TaxID=1723361 RepID=UPI003D7F6092
MSQIGMGILHLIISLSMLVILLLAWKKKSSTSYNLFLLVISSTIIWNFSNAMSYLSSTDKAMIFWHEFKFLGVIPIPLFTLLFALKYCKKDHLLSKKLVYILCILPITFLFFVFTNPFLHLFRKSIEIINLETMTIVVTENGIIFWLNTIYAYASLLASSILLINRFYELPKYYRGQVGVMLISMLPPWLININYIFSFLDENLDLTSISFVLTGLIMYWALFYYSVPEIIPIARDLVVENMQDLVIVTDINSRVLDINLATKELVKKSNINILNRYFKDSLNVVLKDNNAKLYETENGTEVVINNDEGQLYYSMQESPLYENENKLGSVIVFHDITNLKRMMNKLQTMATTDQLTGLNNRIYIDNYLKDLSVRDHLPIAIIKGGINGLKMINDAFGHDVGDEIIIKTAEILRKHTGSIGTISRVGGDEFAIILYNSDENMTNQLLERIKYDCSMNSVGLAKLSICFGYSLMESADDSIFEHVKQADNTMYRKKMMESKSTKSSIIESLKTALEQSDFETKAHAERTQKMALKLGRKVGLKDNQINDLSMLAILHDIGKIAIPHHILMKPSKLTDEEFEIIKTHTEKGYNIALSSPDLVNIAHGILHHHERWDGRGYPMGLKGEDIPIESRIISIVDSYDVMTNERPYNKPMTEKSAIEELKRCRGTQFDPNLVDIMVSLLEVAECEGA